MDFTIVILVLGIFVALIMGYLIGHRLGCFQRDRFWERKMPEHRKDAIMRSRAVLSGQFSEQLAPYLPGFRFKPTECRFIGKPIDLICFEGLDEKEIDRIVFIEVKSGNSKLSGIERKLKRAVEEGRVGWEEWRADLDYGK